MYAPYAAPLFDNTAFLFSQIAPLAIVFPPNGSCWLFSRLQKLVSIPVTPVWDEGLRATTKAMDACAVLAANVIAPGKR